jgi:hypothetical protein
MKEGDKIVWNTSSYDSPESVVTGTVTKVSGKDLCWVNNQHRPEDCIYQAYTYPAEYKDELIAILTERQKLRKAYDDSLKLLFELRNKVTRGDPPK